MISNPKTRLFVSLVLSFAIVLFVKSYFGEAPIEKVCACDLHEIAYIEKSSLYRHNYTLKFMDGSTKTITHRRVTENDIRNLLGDYYSCCVQETQINGKTYFFNVAYITSIKTVWEAGNQKYIIDYVDTRRSGKFYEGTQKVSATTKVEKLYSKWSKNGKSAWDKVESKLRNEVYKDLLSNKQTPEDLLEIAKIKPVLSQDEILDLEILVEIRNKKREEKELFKLPLLETENLQ